MYTNIIHNDDICNYSLKNKQIIFNSLGNCRECRFLSQTGNMISLYVFSSSPAPRKRLPKSSSLLPLLLPRSASSATFSFFVTVYPGKKYLIASSERALNMLSSNGFSILLKL